MRKKRLPRTLSWLTRRARVKPMKMAREVASRVQTMVQPVMSQKGPPAIPCPATICLKLTRPCQTNFDWWVGS